MPRLLALAAGVGGILVFIRARPFRVEATGRSMEPALVPGDYLVATKAGPIRRGALVVVERPGQPDFEMVKRVAAVAGDQVDGRVLERDEYWVVGDRSELSTDSRTFGPVTKDQIHGVVRLRYWPPSRLAWFR